MTTDVAPGPGAQPPAPKKSGILKFLLIGSAGCALLVILVSGGCIGALLYGFKAAKEKPVYIQSLKAAQANPKAQELLGTPIEGSTPNQYSFDTDSGGTKASVTYGVTGPKGSGEIKAAGATANGAFAFSSAVLTVNGQSIDLLAAPSGTPAEAPKP